MKAKGTYTVKKWEESSYQQMTPESKMTKASVEYSLSGEIEGKASVEYLMFYSHFDPKDQHKALPLTWVSSILMGHYWGSREALSSKTRHLRRRGCTIHAADCKGLGYRSTQRHLWNWDVSCQSGRLSF